jgi:membrane-associated phospholipid phosphatase
MTAPRRLARSERSGRLDRRARPLLGGVACLALTLALAAYVGRAHSPPAMDRSTARWLRENHIDALDPAWRGVGLLGGSAALGAVVLASCVFTWRRLDRRWLAFLVGCYTGTEVLFWSLKLVVDRPRPPLSVRLATVASGSFPSGHAAIATAVGASLLIVAAQTTRPGLWRMALATLVGLPLVVGLSRLALGVHWLTDVIGGFLLGLGWVLICAALMQRDRDGTARHAKDLSEMPEETRVVGAHTATARSESGGRGGPE